MKRLVIIASLAIVSLATLALAAAKPLPPLGTQFHALAEGSGKTETEAACLRCHSADLLAQQRLTEKQWTAGVEKMMRWGAAVDEQDKAKIIAYLAKNYGPENKFVPLKTAISSSPRPATPPRARRSSRR